MICTNRLIYLGRDYLVIQKFTPADIKPLPPSPRDNITVAGNDGWYWVNSISAWRIKVGRCEPTRIWPG